jgi:hypothetical protein
MLYQLLASTLMVLTLNIYSAYDQGDPELVTIAQALQNKEIGIALLYLSRFFSGCSAGQYRKCWIDRIGISTDCDRNRIGGNNYLSDRY